MVIVIIAGGSGTRLWPLSTPNYPKHLLKIDGDKLSLLQNTYERAKNLTNDIYVVSEASHIEHVKQQLSDLPDSSFIVEPSRRGTASCIVAALGRISKNHGLDEVIASIHADHFIRDSMGFKRSFELSTKVASDAKRIVLVGVEPDHAATGFGYIKKGTPLLDSQSVYNVDSFKEKPDYNTAQQYLRSGEYLWNCGYFVATLGTFIDNMKEHAPNLYTNYNKLNKSKSSDSYNQAYLAFENEAIDYALIEKVPDLLVVPASFDWMDLGSFGDLHKAIGSDEQGNYMSGNVESLEVDNSLIQNYESKPLAVIGLDNVVVINTEDGILVARKDLAQKVGEISKKVNNK